MTAQSYTSGSAIKARAGIGTADTADDSTFNAIGSAVNDWIEEYIGRAIGPDGSATYTFDGWDAYNHNKTLRISNGIRSITSITVAPVTGASAVAVSTADYHILPRVQDRRTDWPGFEIQMHDIFAGNVPIFWPGYGNIVVSGDFGWASIPPMLSQVALDIGLRLWTARQSGQTDVIGNDEFGTPTVSKVVPGEYRGILRDYKEDRMAVG